MPSFPLLPCDVRTTSKSIIVYTTIPANFQFGELTQRWGVASAWGGQFNLDSAIKSSRAAIISSDIQPFVKVNNEKKEDMLSGRRGNIIAFLAKQKWSRKADLNEQRFHLSRSMGRKGCLSLFAFIV